MLPIHYLSKVVSVWVFTWGSTPQGRCYILTLVRYVFCPLSFISIMPSIDFITFDSDGKSKTKTAELSSITSVDELKEFMTTDKKSTTPKEVK
ncbi:hypothetical protein [uncultured phage MedDCM-OCT-S05-C243]|uniref:Uncharacterized protein n=1 Tax=uncultured phage MedDCM-OCT-S05-C243 TaxID=743558 RepID=D6PHZ8_9CAUD|nr:hypothetical protein HOT86_gp05 [uncultured phage MedDCM-OCT-S05-C243]ADD95349.1 hypothetical protein [uncultured phage MedDCM-OCT-S05-C243]